MCGRYASRTCAGFSHRHRSGYRRHRWDVPRRCTVIVMSDVLAVRAVTFIRAATPILSDIDLTVRSGEHWALLGPNGAGKSSLLNICAAVTFPSLGHVEILGHQLGQIDLRELRRSIGFVNPRHPLRSNLSGEDIILTGATGSIELVPRWEPTDDQRDHARYLMKSLGLGPGLYWHTMSQGERGRALIARALMTDPQIGRASWRERGRVTGGGAFVRWQ